MAYKLETVAGTSEVYARTMRFSNLFDTGDKFKLHITEEIVTIYNNGTVRNEDYGLLYSHMKQTGGKFDDYDPLTGLPMGTQTTHKKLWTLLYSLYMTIAAARDNGIVESERTV